MTRMSGRTTRDRQSWTELDWTELNRMGLSRTAPGITGVEMSKTTARVVRTVRAGLLALVRGAQGPRRDAGMVTPGIPAVDVSLAGRVALEGGRNSSSCLVAAAHHVAFQSGDHH